MHPVRRPDAAQAGPGARARPATGSWARRSTRSTSPRTASASARCSSGSGSAARSGGSPRTAEEAVDGRRADRLPGARAALLRARRPRDAGLLPAGRDVREALERRSTGAVLVDRFLENAIEIDVDALCDGDGHVHRRGDGARRGGRRPLGRLGLRAAGAVAHAATARGDPRRPSRRLAPALGVVGLLNVQFAVADGDGLRARGQPARLAHGAVRARRRPASTSSRRRAGSPPGEKLAGARPAAASASPRRSSVKAAVLPFARFPGADPVLGPEMRSTGEVMASAADLPTAFAKAERAAGRPLPTSGTRLPLGPRRRQGRRSSPTAAALAGLGFEPARDRPAPPRRSPPPGSRSSR